MCAWVVRERGISLQGFPCIVIYYDVTTDTSQHKYIQHYKRKSGVKMDVRVSRESLKHLYLVFTMEDLHNLCKLQFTKYVDVG